MGIWDWIGNLEFGMGIMEGDWIGLWDVNLGIATLEISILFVSNIIYS